MGTTVVVPTATGTGILYTQNVPALVWTVPHNLGYPHGEPVVTDDNGNIRKPLVQQVSDDVTLLTFNEPTAGTAAFS